MLPNYLKITLADFNVRSRYQIDKAPPLTASLGASGVRLAMT